LIDSHAHLTYPDYGEVTPRELIKRAAAAGVDHIVCVAYDISSCEAVVDLAAAEPSVSAVVGIHPHEADRVKPGDLERVEALAARTEVVAIGEMGLDFYRDYADHDNQRRLFRDQLDLAARAQKPVVIHDRDAHDEVLATLREKAGRIRGGVMHCFSGGRDLMEAVLPLGFYVSIPGPVTFAKKNDGKLAEVARECPADRLLVETDCPWLTPAPHRGKRNEPAYVAHVVNRVAEIRGVDPAKLGALTAANARRLFGLGD